MERGIRGKLVHWDGDMSGYDFRKGTERIFVKKRMLSLVLTLVCCLGLTAPVFAYDWEAEIPDELANLIGEITREDGGWSITINPGVPYIPNSSWHAPAESSVVSDESQETDANLQNFKKVNPYRSGMFTDVVDTDWFAKNVKTVYEYGLMSGSGKKFNPRSNVTLAQCLAIACRLHSICETGEAGFKQSGTPWYQVYLDYARGNRLSGAEADRDYNVPATRRDVAKLLHWAMPDSLTAKNYVTDGAVPDVAAGADGYQEIYALYRAGVVGGSGENHAFNPDAPISRAEVAAMAARMADSSLRLDLTIPGPTSGSNANVPSSGSQTRTVDPLWKGKSTSGMLPSFSDKATREKVLALLDQYDPDGAFILRKAGLDFMTWFSFGNRTLLEGVDTAVHEEYHSVSHSASWDETIYYAGNGILLPVTETEVYNSKEMIPYIPSDLRNTSRFDTYINTDEANLSSVKSGIYGLMNEFNAYGCGLNNTVALYDFYRANAKSVDDWFQYVSQGANDRMAYAEFRYYMLTYMLYAKDKHPDVYQGILSNQGFKNTFRLVDDWFTGNVQKYEGTLSDLKQRFESAGHRVQIEGDWFRVDGAGIGIFGGDYQKLMKAIDAEKYQTVLAALKG